LTWMEWSKYFGQKWSFLAKMVAFLVKNPPFWPVTGAWSDLGKKVKNGLYYVSFFFSQFLRKFDKPNFRKKLRKNSHSKGRFWPFFKGYFWPKNDQKNLAIFGQIWAGPGLRAHFFTFRAKKWRRFSLREKQDFRPAGENFASG